MIFGALEGTADMKIAPTLATLKECMTAAIFFAAGFVCWHQDVLWQQFVGVLLMVIGLPFLLCAPVFVIYSLVKK